MKKIDVKGTIVDNQTGEIMSYFGSNSYSYPSKLAQDLKNANGEDVILEINSPGGLTSSGSEMYTALKEYPGTIEAHVVGEADSAGSLVAMAADKVLMSPMAMMMIHRASGGNQGTATDLHSTGNALDQLDQNIVNAYVAKTGKDKDEIYNLMQKTTWMNAETAVNEGFADGLMEFNSKSSNQAPAFVNSQISVPHFNAETIQDFKAFIQFKKAENKKETTKDKAELVNYKLGLLYGGK